MVEARLSGTISSRYVLRAVITAINGAALSEVMDGPPRPRVRRSMDGPEGRRPIANGSPGQKGIRGRPRPGSHERPAGPGHPIRSRTRATPLAAPTGGVRAGLSRRPRGAAACACLPSESRLSSPASRLCRECRQVETGASFQGGMPGPRVHGWQAPITSMWPGYRPSMPV